MEQNRILEGSIYKNIMMFFLPIWMGTFFQQLYNTADAGIVGNFVGKQALAAVGGPTGTIINLLIGFFVGLSGGASVVVAKYYGARMGEQSEKALHTAVALSIAGGILLMAVGIPFSPYALKMMGTPADIMDYACTYIRIYFAGSVFNMIYNIGSGILRAMGNSRKPLQFLIVASLVNIVLDIILVAVFKMGVAGVGIATVISQIVSAVLVIGSLKHMRGPISFSWQNLSMEKSMCSEIFTIGIPAGLQSVMYSLSNIIIQSSINSFGTDTVAAWTAYGKLDAVFWMTVSSFGITATTFVSQNFGAGNYDRMRRCIKACAALAAGFSVALSLMLYVGCPVFYQLFTRDARVIDIGVKVIHSLTPFYVVYVGVEVLSGSLRGVGDSLIPTVITTIGVCVLRVAWVALAVPLNPVFDTVILSYPITWTVTSIAFIIYYMKGNWFKKAVANK